MPFSMKKCPLIETEWPNYSILAMERQLLVLNARMLQFGHSVSIGGHFFMENGIAKIAHSFSIQDQLRNDVQNAIMQAQTLGHIDFLTRRRTASRKPFGPIRSQIR